MFNKTKNKIEEFINNNIYNATIINITKDNKEIYCESFGYNDLDKQTKYNKNTIFALYSAGKPIAALAGLILIQENKLSLDDSVSKYYPNFNADIKIRELLNMTGGITYFWNNPENGEKIKKVFDDVEFKNISLQQFCKSISNIKLVSKPGKKWNYAVSLDILGGIIEKITNLKLIDYMKEKIFNPLEMYDTDFYCKDLNRQAYVYDFIKGEPNQLKINKDYHWLMPTISEQPNACLGGSGLFSTLSDYSKFLNLLIDGKYNNKQIINKDLLNEMRKDQLKEIKDSFDWILNKDYSYGYGVRVRIKNETLPLTEIGEFGWDGALGSSGIIDPINNITITFLVSCFPGNNEKVVNELFGCIYQDLREMHIIK